MIFFVTSRYCDQTSDDRIKYATLEINDHRYKIAMQELRKKNSQNAHGILLIKIAIFL